MKFGRRQAILISCPIGIFGISLTMIWSFNAIMIGRFIFGHDIIVYSTILIFAATVYIFDQTEIGLRIKAVGENPEAADSAGVSVLYHRFLAVVVGCMLVGLAGGYLSVVVSKIWVDGMSGGRGWITIALVIFARWRFWTAMLGAVLFGCVEALIVDVVFYR